MFREVLVRVMLVVLYSSLNGCGGATTTGEHADSGADDAGADARLSGPATCAAAGGKCVIGGFMNCLKVGPQDCNPDRNPGGAYCCLEVDPTCTEANRHIISAADYDQTCTTDSDCIGVGEGDACDLCTIQCWTAAINITAKTRYLADVAKPADPALGTGKCGCPASFAPCCLGGRCHADLMCSAPGP